jgi:uncharacterized protein (DUF433 family)
MSCQQDRAVSVLVWAFGSSKVNLTSPMNVPAGLENLVSIDPEVVGGEPCFTDTRVPLETVVDNLAAGHSVERILKSYPTLRSEHVEAVLRWEANLARSAVGLQTRAS